MNTKAIVAAIIVAALIIGGAIVLAVSLSRPKTARFETQSAQEAWEHQAAGWYCESLRDDGVYTPITTEILELFARTENEAGVMLGEGSPEPNFICTRAAP